MNLLLGSRWRYFLTTVFFLGLAAFLTSCGQTPTPEKKIGSEAKNDSPPFFTDVTSQSGVDFVHRNGEEADHFTILESLGGGVGLIDYDQDGLLDIFLPGGGHFGPNKEILGYPCKLYRNLGAWKFRDVSAETGLDKLPLFYCHGCAVGDFDNDGQSDLLVTGYGRMMLLRNDKSKFVDVTSKANLTDPGPLHWSTSAAWADFNGDGKLDLFVGHYVDWSFQNHPKCGGYNPAVAVDVCPPERFKPLVPALYLGNGDGTFDLRKDTSFVPCKALGVVVADVDEDGKLDIYVANDGMGNHLYLNQGKGQFLESGVLSGVAFDSDGKPNGSMGVDVGDYDQSGRLSIFVANYENETHCLYRNLGNGQFLCSSRATGITSIGLKYVGFGAGFFDFNRDSRLDLFLTNGHAIRFPVGDNRKQRPILFRNDMIGAGEKARVKFTDVSEEGGSYFKDKYVGRGVAFGDLDNDGLPDMVVSATNTPVKLLRNTALPVVKDWLGVQLIGKGPRDAAGAHLVFTQGETRQVRLIKGSGSYLSANDRRVLFAVRTPPADAKLEITWRQGVTETFETPSLPLNRYVTLTEGTGKTSHR